MSGITDSSKFNKNSPYYVAVDANAGGGDVINGNLQITGNLGVGGTTNLTGTLGVTGVTTLSTIAPLSLLASAPAPASFANTSPPAVYTMVIAGWRVNWGWATVPASGDVTITYPVAYSQVPMGVVSPLAQNGPVGVFISTTVGGPMSVASITIGNNDISTHPAMFITIGAA